MHGAVALAVGQDHTALHQVLARFVLVVLEQQVLDIRKRVSEVSRSVVVAELVLGATRVSPSGFCRTHHTTAARVFVDCRVYRFGSSGASRILIDLLDSHSAA